MPNGASRRWVIVMIGLASIVVAYGTWLVLVGSNVPIYAEGFPTPTAYRQDMDIRGSIPLVSGVAVIAGVLLGRLWIAWIGVAAIAAFSIVLLFSSGAALLPVSAILAICLAITMRRRPLAAG